LALPRLTFVGYEPGHVPRGQRTVNGLAPDSGTKGDETMIRGIFSAVDGVATKAAFPHASATVSALSGLLLLSRP
jgi:hypothetical protein